MHPQAGLTEVRPVVQCGKCLPSTKRRQGVRPLHLCLGIRYLFMRHDLIRTLQRLFAAISFMLVLAVGLIIGQAVGIVPAELQQLLPADLFAPTPPQVALISGHAGYDPGAVCIDATGATVLTEAEVNAQVADRVQHALRRMGITVVILEEYDDRLAGLEAGVLLSLHVDSCIDLSGYKAAIPTASPIPIVEARLLDCIDTHYADRTGLAPHPNTITHNMTDYHAFRRVAPQTPTAILELGFLGGDQPLLIDGVERVAAGVAESLRCFLEAEQE